MQVIDRRGTPLTTTFDDLNIGDAFQDDFDDICIKTGVRSAIYWTDGHWALHVSFCGDELILPLEVTYIFERGERRK